MFRITRYYMKYSTYYRVFTGIFHVISRKINYLSDSAVMILTAGRQ